MQASSFKKAQFVCRFYAAKLGKERFFIIGQIDPTETLDLRIKSSAVLRIVFLAKELVGSKIYTTIGHFQKIYNCCTTNFVNFQNIHQFCGSNLFSAFRETLLWRWSKNQVRDVPRFFGLQHLGRTGQTRLLGNPRGTCGVVGDMVLVLNGATNIY